MKPRNEEAYAPEKGLLSHRKKKYIFAGIRLSNVIQIEGKMPKLGAKFNLQL
jgi:hypothetical protein